MLENNCLSCIDLDKKILENNNCICKDGYTILNWACESCHIQCKTCFGINENECKSCDNERYLYLSNCICEISYVSIADVCEKCHYSCL